MKSPFPGMDPYIEAWGYWRDFHADLINEIKRALAAALPERYVVRTEDRNYVVFAETDSKQSHSALPDVGVHSDQPPRATAGGAAVAEPAVLGSPLTMLAFIEERVRENFIEILAVDDEERLVTCIEVLSPTNKRPHTEGWDLYFRKRQALLLGAAHFVEIDLVRGGSRMPMLSPWPASPYYALVCRRARAPYCSVWPAGFREPLPTIPVPLDEPDADIPLPLQPMVDAIYARARYGRRINYSRPLDPPLEGQDLAWLKERLAASSSSS